MTFKNFSKVFESDGEISIKKIENQTVAIDASVEIYRTSHVHIKLTNPAGESTQHITSCFSNMITCLTNNVDAIWNWDAKEANPDKKDENERRHILKEQNTNDIKEMEAELRELEDIIKNVKPEQIKKIAPNILDKINAKKELIHKKKTQNPESNEISRFYRDIKFMIDKLGIKSSVAPTGVEGEQQCAYLCQLGVADAVMSVDPDALLCGAPILYKKISGKSGKYDIYKLQSCLKQHKLTMTQFIQVGVALGTDFVHKVNGIGPTTVIKKLKDDLVDLDEEQEQVVDKFKKKLTYKPVIRQTTRTKKSLDELKTWLIKEQGFNAETLQKRMQFLYEPFEEKNDKKNNN
jgi:5'-3' exonuclease